MSEVPDNDGPGAEDGPWAEGYAKRTGVSIDISDEAVERMARWLVANGEPLSENANVMDCAADILLALRSALTLAESKLAASEARVVELETELVASREAIRKYAEGGATVQNRVLFVGGLSALEQELMDSISTGAP